MSGLFRMVDGVRVPLSDAAATAFTLEWAAAVEIAKLDREDGTRDKRNAILAASDWTQLPDAPLTDKERANWTAYRQALRDVPAQKGFPDAIAWPAEPAKAAR